MSQSTNIGGPSLIGSSGDSLRESFGKTLVALAGKYPQAVVLDADIAGGTGAHISARPSRNASSSSASPSRT